MVKVIYLYSLGIAMIESYEFGHIVVSGKHFNHDIIIFPDHIQSDWWRKESHKLFLEDLETILTSKPKTLIVGTGYDGMMQVEEEVRKYCKENNIDFIEQPTREAVKTFNKMNPDGVIAALHLTC